MREQLKKIAAGVVPVLVLAHFAASPAQGYQASIFTEILGTINNTLGGPLGQINQIEGQMRQFEQTVLYPQQLMTATQGLINSSNYRYLPYMQSVSNLSISSATLSATQALERSIQQSGTSPATPYRGTYGAPSLTSTQQALSVKQEQDITDAMAIDGMDLSARANTAANTFTRTAAAYQTQAASAAAGTAPLLIAQEHATELAELAATHQLLASQLRLVASQVAQQALKRKRTIAGATNTPMSIDR
jgi:hypothetical protein